jgi:KipI family sensor histidine kinase inhibitor
VVVRFLPVGDAAVLVELDDLAATLALFAAVEGARLDGVTDLVPGARTLLVRFDADRVGAGALVAAIRALPTGGASAPRARTVEIPVRYEGDDLAEVADLLGIAPQEVVRRHTGTDYTVAFTGFAPGFAYLTGGDGGLDVPRRSTPRTRIPAGAVGLAGPFSGVYPRESPGGWQIIGVTGAEMWNLRRPRPALLQPGDHVRFVEVTGRSARVDPSPSAGPSPAAVPADLPPAAPPADGPALEIVHGGVLSVLQDLGRPGNAGLGVSPSGALDALSLRTANRLVGNPVSTAAIEIVYGGFSAVSAGDTVVAVAGAPAPITVTRAGGRTVTVGFGAPFALAAGDRFSIGAPEGGIRSYAAVRGGFAVEPVLGSLSTDTLSGLGPAPLVAGTLLPVATPAHLGAVEPAVVRPPGVEPLAVAPNAPEQSGAVAAVTLDIVLGPRTDWFTAEAVALVCGQAFTVSAQSNRVGLRLEGAEPLTRAVAGELPSEGTIAGALQVPPSGQPVLFLADHPLTGGYPVIACVVSHHLGLAGQLLVGAAVRFRVVGGLDAFAPHTGETGPVAPTRTTEDHP